MTSNAYVHPRTQQINKAQALKANQTRVDALKWLADVFPEAFNTKERVRPLKKGILRDIFDYMATQSNLPFSKNKIREAVVMFTRRMEYLVCVKLRGGRIDLQGEFAAHVTDEEAEYAAEKIRLSVESAIEKADKPPRSRRYEACEKFAPRKRDQIRKEQQARANNSNSSPSQQKIFPSGAVSKPQHHYPSDYSNYYAQQNASSVSRHDDEMSHNNGATQSTPPQTQVTVKRKAAKKIDPEAVARLKKKLGIKKETA